MMNDVIVLGGGPSGIAAAVYCIQMGLRTVLISPDLGGKLNNPFSLRSMAASDTVRGAATVRSMVAQLPSACHVAARAVEIQATHDHVGVVLDTHAVIEGKTMIYAVGVQPRRLYIPGELHLQDKGVSYSAVSHASLCVGLEVAVLGNHPRALASVLMLARLAHHVLFIVPPGTNRDLLSDDFLHDVAVAQNVTVLLGWELTAIEGREYVKRLVFHNEAGNHRYAPVDVLFIEFQVLPNTDLVAHLVERNADGYIRVNQRCATSHPLIFAAGDATNAYGEQVPVAIGEGIKAALNVSDYVGMRLNPANPVSASI